MSVRTISKWRRRYRLEGEQGLLDRCSAPESVPLLTAEGRVCVIAGLRRLRMTAAEIAETLGMPVSTVSGILTRIGLGKLWRFEAGGRHASPGQVALPSDYPESSCGSRLAIERGSSVSGGVPL